MDQPHLEFDFLNSAPYPIGHARQPIRSRPGPHRPSRSDHRWRPLRPHRRDRRRQIHPARCPRPGSRRQGRPLSLWERGRGEGLREASGFRTAPHLLLSHRDEEKACLWSSEGNNGWFGHETLGRTDTGRWSFVQECEFAFVRRSDSRSRY